MYIASSSFIVQDMTGIQVFNPEGFFVSRVWRSHKPWECFGLAEDEQRRLWFIDFNWRSKETHLKCYDLKEEKPVKGISLKEQFGFLQKMDLPELETASSTTLPELSWMMWGTFW